jgi:hypothetical protein
MEKKSVFDQIQKGLADAITDIREKVVEEPWYGRVVNERDTSAPQWPEAQQAQPEPVECSREHSAEDIDIDR